MRRARDVREQIEGLMTRVEIEMTSNPIDDVAIRKVYAHLYVLCMYISTLCGCTKPVKHGMQ